MELFKSIYHGDFRPADGIRYSDAYDSELRGNFAAHQKFRETLQEEQRMAFDELRENDMALSGRCLEENYILGMKMGIQLMMEVFNT